MFKGIVLKRVLPFVLAAFSGAFVYYMFAPIGVPAVQTSVSESGSGICRGNGPGRSGSGSGFGTFTSEPGSTKVSIISKPAATYTDAARENLIEGTVRLKVALLASGQVGSITPVTKLPYGLTEQAIAAARLIQFEPKRVNDRPFSTVVTVDYRFDIYE